MSQPILCLDFDGVLHSYASGWKGAAIIPDPPMPGAIEALREYTKHFRVAVFSSRSSMEGGVPAMLSWIERWARITYGEHDIAWVSLIDYPVVKPPARVSLDDRALTFTGVWPSVRELMDFQPFYHPSKSLEQKVEQR